jgi:hypothetical protein
MVFINKPMRKWYKNNTPCFILWLNQLFLKLFPKTLLHDY